MELGQYYKNFHNVYDICYSDIKNLLFDLASNYDDLSYTSIKVAVSAFFRLLFIESAAKRHMSSLIYTSFTYVAENLQNEVLCIHMV